MIFLSRLSGLPVRKRIKRQNLAARMLDSRTQKDRIEAKINLGQSPIKKKDLKRVQCF